MKRRGPQHERAEAAHKAVAAVQDLDAFLRAASALPALIHVSGLGQAAAMCATASRGGEGAGYQAVLCNLEDWLCAQCKWRPYGASASVPRNTETPGVALLAQLTNGGREAYVAATAEALQYVAWLKRLASAEALLRSVGTAGKLT